MFFTIVVLDHALARLASWRVVVKGGEGSNSVVRGVGESVCVCVLKSEQCCESRGTCVPILVTFPVNQLRSAVHQTRIRVPSTSCESSSSSLSEVMPPIGVLDIVTWSTGLELRYKRIFLSSKKCFTIVSSVHPLHRPARPEGFEVETKTKT